MHSATIARQEPLPPPSAWRRYTTSFRGDRKMLIGSVILALLILLAIFGPFIAPYDPDVDDYELFAAPSWEHPFGTDSFGRDIFSRMMAGTQISLGVGASVAILSMVVGVALGLTAGYFGGWVDSLIMRLMDFLWAFPEIILTVGLVAIFGAGIRNIIIAISIAYLDDFARIVRADVLRLREEEFTVAARSVGASDWHIILHHILPNTMAPIIVQATFAVGLGILAESGLTFLGLGVDPATPTWGATLSEGRDFIRNAWWISVFPGLAIMITVLSLNLLGDSLRDLLDVRS
jgi:peptide/nickel transport system permease protein